MLSYKIHNLYCLPYISYSSFIGFYSPVVDLRLLLFFGFLIYFDIWQDSLDEWSARRKASTYTGQHNTERRW
jgi:hypothetical protein